MNISLLVFNQLVSFYAVTYATGRVLTVIKRIGDRGFRKFSLNLIMMAWSRGNIVPFDIAAFHSYVFCENLCHQKIHEFFIEIGTELYFQEVKEKDEKIEMLQKELEKVLCAVKFQSFA